MCVWSALREFINQRILACVVFSQEMADVGLTGFGVSGNSLCSVMHEKKGKTSWIRTAQSGESLGGQTKLRSWADLALSLRLGGWDGGFGS